MDGTELEVAREQLIRDGLSREKGISVGIAAFNAARELVPEPVFLPSVPPTFDTSTEREWGLPSWGEIPRLMQETDEDGTPTTNPQSPRAVQGLWRANSSACSLLMGE